MVGSTPNRPLATLAPLSAPGVRFLRSSVSPSMLHFQAVAGFLAGGRRAPAAGPGRTVLTPAAEGGGGANGPYAEPVAARYPAGRGAHLRRLHSLGPNGAASLVRLHHSA